MLVSARVMHFFSSFGRHSNGFEDSRISRQAAGCRSSAVAVYYYC